MKFSRLKKAKMKKLRERRLNRMYGSMIGNLIYPTESGEDMIYIVRDRCKVNGNIYYLASNVENKYENIAIFKLSGIANFTKLSEKKIAMLRKDFLHYQNWDLYSLLKIKTTGRIREVKYGSCFGPKGKHDGMLVCIIVD